MKLRNLGGDGNRSIIEALQFLKVVDSQWIAGGGNKWLLHAEGGLLSGRYFAIESRVQSSLLAQAEGRKIVSAILYQVDFQGDLVRCLDVGMIVLAVEA